MKPPIPRMLLCTTHDAVHGLQLRNGLLLARSRQLPVELLLLQRPFPMAGFSSANGIGLPQALQLFERQRAAHNAAFDASVSQLRESFRLDITCHRADTDDTEATIIHHARALDTKHIVLALAQPPRRLRMIQQRLQRELDGRCAGLFVVIDDHAAAMAAATCVTTPA